MFWRIQLLFLWAATLLYPPNLFSAIKSNYFCADFTSIKDTIPTSKSEKLLNCTEDNPIFLRSITFNDSLSVFLNHLQSLDNKPLDAALFEKLLEKAIKNANRQGYPFFKITPRLKFIAEDSVDIVLDAENYHSTIIIDTLVLPPDAGISKTFIIGCLRIKEGNVFNVWDFERYEHILRRYSFITLQGPISSRFSLSGAIVEIPAKGTTQGSFGGMVGLATNSVSGKTIFTGDINLSLINGLKRGETIKVSWKRPTELSQFLETEAEYPFIIGSQYGVSAGFALQKQDTTLINLKSFFNGFIQYSPGTRFSFGIDYRNTSFLSSAIQKNNAQRLLYSGGVGFWWDDEGNKYRGGVVEFSTGLGQRRTTQDSLKINSVLFDIKLKGGYSFPLYQNIVLQTEASAGSLQTKTLLQSEELTLLGGVNTIRGFDEKSLYVKDWIYSTVETHWYFEEKSSIFPFFQGGGYSLVIDGKVTERRFYSFGIGSGLMIGSGKLLVYWAMGKNVGEKLFFRNSKIHLGYRIGF